MTQYPAYNAIALPRYPFDQIHAVATQADNDGDVVQLASGLFGVVQGLGGGNDAVAVGDPVCFRIAGVYDVLCYATTDIYNDGAPVYYDTVNNCAVTTASGTCFYLGTAVGAKAAGPSRVRVLLNGNIAPNLGSAASVTTLTVSSTALLGGNATVSGTLHVTGAAFFASTVALAGTVTLTNAGLSFLYGTGAAAAASGVLMGGGTTANPCTTASANTNFIELRTQSSATSGTSRSMYLRHNLSGAGQSGECLRAYTDLTAAMGAGTSSHGAHISIQVGSTGYTPGEAIGVRGQLYVKGTSQTPAGGSYWGVMAEMYFEASADISLTTEAAPLCLRTNGDVTGQATCVNAVSIKGTTGASSATMISSKSLSLNVTCTNWFAVVLNGARCYVPCILASVLT